MNFHDPRRTPLDWLLGGLLAFLLLLVVIGLATVARADDNLPWPETAAQLNQWEGPMLICWQADPLIAALQPGVQGLPEQCGTIESPRFMILERVWTTPEPLVLSNGTRWMAAVYRINIEFRRDDVFTVLAEEVH